MRKRWLRGLVLGVTSAALVLSPGWVGAGRAADEPAKKEAEPAKKKAAGAKAKAGAKGDKAAAAKKPAARLPNFYADVVNEEQRAKILAIQQQYSPKLDDLKAQLKALQQQRDAEIVAVLTPAQRKQVAEAKVKARVTAAKAAPDDTAKPEKQ